MRITENKINKYKDKYEALLKKEETISVLFAGVGGQGILMATAIMAKACLFEGFDVKVSEIHGMAQRGGSVVGSIRFGKKVFSPTVDSADFVVSLEEVEPLRYIDIFKEDSILIYNTYRIYPSSVYGDGYSYPENVRQLLLKFSENVFPIDAYKVAKQHGKSKAMNTALLGFFSNFLPISADSWEEAIKDIVSPAVLEINLNTFKAGKSIIYQ
ncbi:MAG: indolepyruvate oxidoreductase subunit beta [Actinomycetota bacterium]|jgi:indolepyruvate ferredoxin oxidoreductase beta subunit|nr:indolepyruvate oxidoreductase subunit beta [Actinomycetota bacterium]